jgi:cathepsin B
MLQLCKKDNIADLLYSEQRKVFSHIVVYVNSHPDASWTAKIPEKYHGASHKEDLKLKGNIFFHN